MSCVLQGWQNTGKNPVDRDQWKKDHYASEISAFHLALPTAVWRRMKSTIVPMMVTEEARDGRTKETYCGYLWVWQMFLLPFVQDKMMF